MKIDKLIDFKFEAINLIQKINSASDKDKEEINSYINLGIEKESLKKLFQNYFKFKDKVLNNIPKLKAKLIPYLKVISEYDISIINHYYLFSKNKAKSVEEMMDDYYLELFNNFFDYNLKTISLEKIIAIVSKLDFSSEDKLAIISFYKNKELLQDLETYIDKVANIISKYFHIVEEEVNLFIENLSKTEKEGKLESKINNFVGSKLFKADKDIIVHAKVFNYNSFLFANSDIYIGFLAFKLQTLRSKYYVDEKRLLSSLKTISDSTRFKVLRLLKDNKMYAQELARQLDLTSATLKHHLNILVSENLVSMFFQDGDKKRVYYMLNDKQIDELTRELRSYFKLN